MKMQDLESSLDHAMEQDTGAIGYGGVLESRKMKRTNPSQLDLNRSIWLLLGLREMMEGEALLNQLCMCLASDSYLDELGFVHPSELSRLSLEVCTNFEEEIDRSAFWFGDHRLAIALPALPSLHRAAKAAFLVTRKEFEHKVEIRTEELQKCQERLMTCSRALVLLHCDYATAWNARKKVLSVETRGDILIAELRLVGLVLSIFSKSEEAWAHRRWVIKRYSAMHCGRMDALLVNESKFTEHVAEKYSMNYRAWRHRCWLVPLMSTSQVQEELVQTRKWISDHVADNCGFHYRRCLLAHLLNGSSLSKFEHQHECFFGSLPQLLREELDWTTELIKYYIGREALWMHRRFLASVYFTYRQSFMLIQAEDQMWELHKRSELNFVDECISSCDRNLHPELALQQQEYASAYKLWILFLERAVVSENSALMEGFPRHLLRN